MGFLGVYRALYDYTPQSEGELVLVEGDLLYILEKSTEDDWWKAKKRAAEDEEEEPEGLIPNTYIEEVSRPTLTWAEKDHPILPPSPAPRSPLFLPRCAPTV